MFLSAFLFLILKRYLMNIFFKSALLFLFANVAVSSCSKTDGPEVEVTVPEPEPEPKPEPEPVVPEDGATLLLGGAGKVTIVNTGGMENGCDYTPFVVGQWDAESAALLLGYASSKMDHIDDCKPVDGGEMIAVTSSYHWTVVLDKELKPVFWASGTTNAHSAEVIRGKYVVVACSTGGDELRLYDMAVPNKVIFTTPLESAHGVVWNEATERLYAVGVKKLRVYKLTGYGTDSPELTLEKTYATPQNGLHDITLADDNTLCLGGKGCALFNISTGKFTTLPLFADKTALKSLNYNPETGGMWYTDATVPEGDYTWSTHTVRYTSDPFGCAEEFTIRVPDQNLYKVRPLKW